MNLNRANLELQDIHQQPQEAGLLYQLIVSHMPERIFEVGSYQGGSARIIVQAFEDAGIGAAPERIFMIDPEPRLTDSNRVYLDGKATIIANGSPQAYRALPFPEKGFGMAFIDGDHAEDSVYRDIVEAYPLMLPGAIVLCHDSHFEPTKRGILRGASDAGFADCGEMVSLPVLTDQYQDGYRVMWGGFRMLRKPA